MANVIAKIIKQPEKLVYGLERLGLLDWVKDEPYIKMTYRLAFRRKLNLEAPRALTEKINWYKLNYRDPLMRQCADKYDVRAYVKKTIGGVLE